MTELDRKLARGPLRVESLFRPERAADVARRALGQRRRRALRLALLAAGASLLLGGLLAWPEPRTPSAAYAPRAPELTFFADGSHAEPRDLAARVITEEQSGERVRVRLHGGARFDVRPNPARTFEVYTQQLVVRVLGTAFSIDPQGAQTRVRVERGLVQVRWSGGSALLSAGEVGLFPRPSAPAPIEMAAMPSSGAQQIPARDASSAELAAQVGAPSNAELAAKAVPPSKRERAANSKQRATTAGHAEAPEALDKRAARPTSAAWRVAAEAGDYRRAYAELARSVPADEPTELLLAADVARQSAHPEVAVALLQKLCTRFPRDKRAPVAAFTLGRVLRDDLRRSAEAAVAFEQASAAWPEGPLAEQALARAVEAYSEVGNRERARELAALALRRFPQGRQAEAMREALAR